MNRLAIPAGRPVHLSLTSGTVIQSLLMPRLAGQIYAMAGMRTQLNFAAEAPGAFWGENAQFNGMGFQNEKFDIAALDPVAFARWLAETKAQPNRLDTAEYETLSHRSTLPRPLDSAWSIPACSIGSLAWPNPAAMRSRCKRCHHAPCRWEPACPHVGSRDAFYWRKRNSGAYKPADHYRDIELPKESACGKIIGLAAAICCFGLIWRIWWMAGLFLIVVVLTVIARSFMRDVTRIIPAATVEAVDRRWLAQARQAAAIPRQLEQSERNQGLAQWMA